MKKLILSGACGRMGREVAQHAAEAGFDILAGVDVHSNIKADFPIYTSFSFCQGKADVLIDFSRPDALPHIRDFIQETRLPVVLCATGYSESDIRVIESLSRETAVFQSSNMSLGVYVIGRLVSQAAYLLHGFDIEIVEKHHNQKEDSPSGTALALLNSLSEKETLPVFGRHANVKRRDIHEIGVHAVRGGTITGVHEVGFYGPDETVTITHTAQSRAVFALGALRAALYLIGKPNGLYGMKDLADTL